MNTTFRRCSRVPLRFRLAVLASLLLATASHATTDDPVLAWRLYAGSEPPPFCDPPEGEALPCGTWGEYRLDEGEFETSECGTTAEGNESPPPFVPSGWPAPAPEDWFPCRDGACFAPGPGEEPWAAVIDWDDPHGWSVGQTLLQAADLRVEARLFPLDEPPASVLDVFEVGDAHLLAQLCTLAEELDTGPANLPLVVNISAGRLATGTVATTDDPPTLASQILGLIDHLSTSHGIAFVAAAGHHRTQLFPAHLPPVLAVGPVDLAKQRYTGQARHSWQADGELRTLFPGNGLELFSEDVSPRCWPVPAGASFASATAAGWIAAYRTEGGGWNVADAGAVWAPVEIAGRFHLMRERSLLPGTDFDGPSDLVAGAVDGLACGEAPETADAVLEVGAVIPSPIQILPSLVELIDEIGPSPENEPCVPCDIPGQFGPAGEILRLEASRALWPDYRIVDLFLLTDGTFHRLESESKLAILEQLENAALDTLELRDFRDVHLQPWHEALLVFHLLEGERGLWTSVPIDVLP
ncbi:MAG: S8/S53 family peptidase [Actinomycetota bacterium]